MSYERINPVKQFNFQINRVLTYGEAACDMNAVRHAAASVRTLSDWNEVWTKIADDAVEKKEYLHAAYAFRMVEFFLKESDSRKETAYRNSICNYYLAFDQQLHLKYEKHSIPFSGAFLNCLKIPAEHSGGTVLVCGGYDSFIEEFVLQVYALTVRGYDVILFEGPGQGQCLRQKLYFRYDFEKPASAVLDYFKISKCAMVGISWGGFFALRSAAFEKRIRAAAAFDTLYDGREVMMHVFPGPISKILNTAYRHGKSGVINTVVNRLRKKSILADWAISQGMYITGTQDPYAFYQSLSGHTLKGIADMVTQDVLLLAGEHDHYIPADQIFRAKESLINAASLTVRIFTAEEGGEQHCQIGNTQLAIDTILDWLDRIGFAAPAAAEAIKPADEEELAAERAQRKILQEKLQ